MAQDPEKDSEKHPEDIEPSRSASTTEDDTNVQHPPPTVLSRKESPEPLPGLEHVDNEQPRRSRQHSTTSTHSSTSTRSDHSHHDPQLPPHRTRSRAQSSTRSTRPQPTIVPRSSRRGLFARFCLINEITNAFDYSRRMKWTITFIVAVAGSAAPMGSSIVLPALVDIARDFNSTATVVNLSVAFYMLSMSIFPLWWSSFSETLGRRTIYVVSFGLFLVFNVLSAVSTSIGMFIAMRVFSGGAAASVQAVGAGTIADVWEVKERGRAMGIFYLGPLCGPLLSPILGGVLAQTLGWRSAQWFLAIFAVLLFILIVLLLPETLRQRKSLSAAAEQEASEPNPDSTLRPTLTRITTQRSVALKAKKYTLILRRVFLDPLRIILYLQLPAVAILVAYAAVTFGSLYVLNISIQQTFSSPPYSYGSIIVGCLYIPNSAGYFISSIFGGRWVDKIMQREAVKAGRYDEKGRLQFIPEDRMKENAWLGMLIYPLSLIAYGWCAEYKVNVAAPMVANFFFGVGSMLIFALVTTMLTEFMPRKSSHGIALNNFVRNIFSCVGTIVTEPLIVAIGNGWLFLGLGVISLVSGGLTIWAMKRFGPRWREGMERGLERVAGGEKG
ncbi:unnamed protein product [Zymoseptoria tritici ST99CH_1A5]|uniref:Major facilitator superfamily (MFS) profile domain-containing protein n=1 Tax=Zymoseptoria tritici ST99CH_1A5 TaxID=1276529 RepID=A0A1Y6L334_ZYMTR|nr:unnamed protein product [Zymoseptoria tritici ST99CH_1A5]